jgi:hypothetical protein
MMLQTTILANEAVTSAWISILIRVHICLSGVLCKSSLHQSMFQIITSH